MARGGRRFASRKLSIWSRRPLAAIDRRTLEGRREKEVEAELVAHVGGSPSAVQKILIARAARLTVTVELMERRLIESGEVGDLNGRQVLAWVNSLRQVLVALGVEKPEAQVPRLADILRARAA
jgi:hypothetical protein